MPLCITWDGYLAAYKDNADCEPTLKLLASHIQERMVYYALSLDELNACHWQEELDAAKAACR
jgi:hypothetical protein